MPKRRNPHANAAWTRKAGPHSEPKPRKEQEEYWDDMGEGHECIVIGGNAYYFVNGYDDMEARDLNELAQDYEEYDYDEEEYDCDYGDEYE